MTSKVFFSTCSDGTYRVPDCAPLPVPSRYRSLRDTRDSTDENKNIAADRSLRWGRPAANSRMWLAIRRARGVYICAMVVMPEPLLIFLVCRPCGNSSHGIQAKSPEETLSANTVSASA